MCTKDHLLSWRPQQSEMKVTTAGREDYTLSDLIHFDVNDMFGLS